MKKINIFYTNRDWISWFIIIFVMISVIEMIMPELPYMLMLGGAVLVQVAIQFFLFQSRINKDEAS